MLISKERGLIFVHIQKTGGETISQLLRAQIPDLQRVLKKHQRVCDALDAVDDLHRYFVFSFVRNPWERLVSWYSMIQEAERIHASEKRGGRREMSHRRQVRQNKLWRYALEESSDFPSFVKNCTESIEVQPSVHYSFAYNQIDYLTDRTGRILASFIGRFEHFHDDITEAFRLAGLKEIVGLPHENRSSHGDYTAFYTQETAEIVRRRFARGIQHFGYTFGDDDGISVSAR